MIGNVVGYIRVSSFDQNVSRQLDGLALNRVFIDKASGKDARRPKLENLKQFVRDGDTVVVPSMDRLARNLDDLRQIVRTLTEKGANGQILDRRFENQRYRASGLNLVVAPRYRLMEHGLLRTGDSDAARFWSRHR
jgi:DNA invertase Pin-like site-specific DNA recombinase